MEFFSFSSGRFAAGATMANPLRAGTLPLVLAALLLAVPAAGRDAGQPRPLVPNVAGQVKFGPVLTFAPEADEPGLSFDNTAASLLFSGRLPGPVSYLVHPSMAGGRFILLDCHATWQPAAVFGLVAGQHKTPFDRVYGSSAVRLLFGTRNPLVALFSPQYQLGVTASLSPAAWLKLSAGAYNGHGLNQPNVDPGLMYAAGLEITPLGPLPPEESAHRGYADPVLVLFPGVWQNRENHATGQQVMTTALGTHAATRWRYLALDGAYYRRRSVSSPGETTSTTDGLTIQGGYAFAGRYEPIARFTMVGLDNATTTIEAGFNWYLNSYASRLGLNLQCLRPPDTDPGRTLRLYYEFQF